MSDSKSLPYIIGCDCDPDRASFNNRVRTDALSWDGIYKGINNFIEKRKLFSEKNYIKFNITWFVRSDLQIKYFYSKPGYCLEKFNEIWQKLSDEGDEIAWHPHLWQTNKDGKWFQEIENDNFILDCLSQGLESYVKFWGEKPKTVHAGWGFQNNTTMKFFSESSIIADCSAMPGTANLTGNMDKSDWSLTGYSPYMPSKKNYQIDAKATSDNLNILEVPCSMGQSKKAQFLKNVRDKIKRKTIFNKGNTFEEQVPLMALLPTINNELIKSSISKTIKNETNYFLSYIHADELLYGVNQSGLHSRMYSMNSLFKNVLLLNNIIKLYDYSPVSMNLVDYASKILSQNLSLK